MFQDQQSTPPSPHHDRGNDAPTRRSFSPEDQLTRAIYTLELLDTLLSTAFEAAAMQRKLFPDDDNLPWDGLAYVSSTFTRGGPVMAQDVIAIPLAGAIEDLRQVNQRACMGEHHHDGMRVVSNVG